MALPRLYSGVMSNVDGIALLRDHILLSKALKEEDRKVIHDVCEKLRIMDDPGMINEYFRLQVENEASIVYLIARYGELMDRLKNVLAKHRADTSLDLGSKDDEGYKRTKASRENWLLATDARYVALLDSVGIAERLFFTLKNLEAIVMKRDGKLEQLSINYRREQEVDNRTNR